MAEKKLHCKACAVQLSGAGDSYLINQQGDRICKSCGDEIIIKTNADTPGRVKIVDLEGGKALVLIKP
jgi:hypothetical protein